MNLKPLFPSQGTILNPRFPQLQTLKKPELHGTGLLPGRWSIPGNLGPDCPARNFTTEKLKFKSNIPSAGVHRESPHYAHWVLRCGSFWVG